MNSLHRLLYCHRTIIVTATTASIGAVGLITEKESSSHHQSHYCCACESSASASASFSTPLDITVHRPSLWARLGIISHPLPRLLTPNDPAFKIPKRFFRQRQSNEERMRQLLTEKAPKIKRNDPEFEKKIGILREEIFQLAYGKGVTAQMREDFLIKCGCTGFNDDIINRLVELCATRGVVEIGAGHGQWEKALTDAYGRHMSDRSIITAKNNEERLSSKLTPHEQKTKKRTKRFDFVLAYDNNSNLPLNTHIYNQYTQPHHDYFGNVAILQSETDVSKVLRSWACRGRALLLVYPPPGQMAIDTVKTYIDAASENDTLIYVGEGRGGANGDDTLFDLLENGEWILIEVMDVVKPPGDKGCEKLYVLHHKKNK
jgi:hypothetical protein